MKITLLGESYCVAYLANARMFDPIRADNNLIIPIKGGINFLSAALSGCLRRRCSVVTKPTQGDGTRLKAISELQDFRLKVNEMGKMEEGPSVLRVAGRSKQCNISMGSLNEGNNRAPIVGSPPDATIGVYCNSLTRQHIAGPTCALRWDILCPASMPAPNTSMPAASPRNWKRRIVVTSLNWLRPHYRLRADSSYESTVVDILRLLRGYNDSPDYGSSNLLQTLLGFPHDPTRLTPNDCVITLVFRINNSAMLVYDAKARKLGGPWLERACLHVLKARPVPFNNDAMGYMQGYTMLVGASLLASIVDSDITDFAKYDFYAGLNRSAPLALVRLNSWFCSGLSGLLSPLAKALIDGTPAMSMVALPTTKLAGLSKCDFPKPKQNVFSVPVSIARAASYKAIWHLTEDLVRQHKSSREPSKLDLPLAKHALSWLTHANISPKAVLPIWKVGDMELADRREIENFLLLHRTLNRYWKEPAKAPVNVGVFGSPGSGKSFGVKELVKFMSKSGGPFLKTFREFNLSQFQTVEELWTSMQLVRDDCLTGQIPIVFFDEFDCNFQGQTFGWLKYFLAPMLDGAFFDGNHAFRLGKCVFIFAGGVNRTFEEFAGRVRNVSFCEAKGPDFVSRLKCHLDIRGIDQTDMADGDQHYLIRRALQLRQKLLGRIDPDSKGGTSHLPLMHPDVARAFLKIPSFRHGSRSLNAILDASTIDKGRTFGPSDLPPKPQLELHVDSATFYKHLNLGE